MFISTIGSSQLQTTEVQLNFVSSSTTLVLNDTITFTVSRGKLSGTFYYKLVPDLTNPIKIDIPAGDVKANAAYPGTTVSGTYANVNFTVPANVTSISAVCIGGGGGGGGSNSSTYYSGAGGGGSLTYANNISVTPGEVLRLQAGYGGSGGGYNPATNGYAGSQSSLIRTTGNVTLLTAPPGLGGNRNNTTSNGAGGSGGAIGSGGTGVTAISFRGGYGNSAAAGDAARYNANGPNGAAYNGSWEGYSISDYGTTYSPLYQKGLQGWWGGGGPGQLMGSGFSGSRGVVRVIWGDYTYPSNANYPVVSRTNTSCPEFSNTSTTGTVTITNGTGTISRTVTQVSTSGEQFYIALYSDSAKTRLIAVSDTITIN